MKAIKCVILVTLMVTFASCCGCRKNRSSIPLNGTRWHLIQLGGENITSDGYLMTFGTDGRISGVGDCNNFSGPFTRNLKQLKVADNLVSNRKMCLNQAREDKFLKMLLAIDSYSIDGNRLVLIKNGDVQAIFEAVPTVAEAESVSAN